MKPKYYIRQLCRLCSCNKLNLVLPLQPTALCDAYVKADRLDHAQDEYPLELYQCDECGFAQIGCIVDLEAIDEDYKYVSSSPLNMSGHFDGYANSVLQNIEFARNTLVLDIGSNDGLLLRNFKKKGMRVLGIEPAGDTHEAKESGIDTLAEYFDIKTSEKVIKDYGHAGVVTVNNLFANIDELEEFVIGIRNLLSPDGVLIIETSYLIDLIQNMVFDYVYHEHLSYFSVRPLKIFFSRLGMELFHVERISTKGGSIRLYIQLSGGSKPVQPFVAKMIKDEEEKGLYTLDIYREFSAKISSTKLSLRNMLTKLKKDNKTIAAYGGSATSTTLIYHFGLDDFIEYIVDDNPAKQDTFSPGLHIPVLPSSMIYERNPDYIVLLAWRFAKPIIKKHEYYLQQGGHFILPLPEVEVV
jgi:SAM-dependent methyltransferase